MPKRKQQAARRPEALLQQCLSSFQQRHNAYLHILCSSTPYRTVCYCTAERRVAPFLRRKAGAAVAHVTMAVRDQMCGRAQTFRHLLAVALAAWVDFMPCIVHVHRCKKHWASRDVQLCAPAVFLQ
jgi:hypothetical protein